MIVIGIVSPPIVVAVLIVIVVTVIVVEVVLVNTTSNSGRVAREFRANSARIFRGSSPLGGAGACPRTGVCQPRSEDFCFVKVRQ